MARLATSEIPKINPILSDVKSRFLIFIKKAEFTFYDECMFVYAPLPWYDFFSIGFPTRICMIENYESYTDMKIYVYDYRYLKHIIYYFPEDHITIVV